MATGSKRSGNEAPEKTTTATSASHSSTLFWKLPAELKEMVWEAYLPNRVVQLSSKAHDSVVCASHRDRQWPPSSNRRPSVANVCYQARQVVNKNGSWKIGGDGQPVWFDASRDTILLNGDRSLDYALMDELIAAARRGVGKAIIARIKRAQMLGGGCLDDNTGMLISCLHQARGGVAVSGRTLSRLGARLFPLLNRNDFCGPRMVFFDDVCISGTRQQALESGLFGRFLDARMFFVRLDDTETLLHILEVGQRPGGVHIGHMGFIRSLLKGSTAAQNQRLLGEHYLKYCKMHLRSPRGKEPLADLAPLEHVVLFRYCEEPEEG